MTIWTNWDPLEEAIVGDCYSAGQFDHFIPTDIRDDFNQILTETKQDLDALAQTLTELDVRVHRPRVVAYPEPIDLADFAIHMPMPPVVPRDQYLAYGSTIYQTYTSMPDRYLDSRSYYDIFFDLHQRGYNWISMPPPSLENLSEFPQFWSKGGEIYRQLDDRLLWHAATMFKCGDAIIVNSAGPGTQKGLAWMQRNMPDCRFVINHNTVCNNWGHIDHGFFMINDDVVVCAERNFVPECLRHKKLIEFAKVLKPDTTVSAYFSQLWHSVEKQHTIERLKNYITQWNGYEQEVFFDTNVLVVDSNNIVVSTIPDRMAKILRYYDVEVHVCHQRHGLFWDSGIHCATLDLSRRGAKRSVAA